MQKRLLVQCTNTDSEDSGHLRPIPVRVYVENYFVENSVVWSGFNHAFREHQGPSWESAAEDREGAAGLLKVSSIEAPFKGYWLGL